MLKCQEVRLQYRESPYHSKNGRPTSHAFIIGLNCCGLRSSEIAKRTGITGTAVAQILKKYGVPSNEGRGKGKKTVSFYGERNNQWKGGRFFRHGYVLVSCPDHPRRVGCGYVREHILIAEKMLGRPLRFFGPADPRTEVVHHINKNRSDNRPENLCVLTAAAHNALHRKKGAV